MCAEKYWEIYVTSTLKNILFLSDHTDQSYSQLLRDSSDTIRIARVLCIFMMTYAHVSLFSSGALENVVYFSSIKNVLINLFARSSVPLLSVISGILMVAFFSNRSISEAIRTRFKTLIIPFLTWSVIGLGIAELTGRADNYTGSNLLYILNGSYYIQLIFLRDIFVVSSLTPLIIYLARKFNILFLVFILLFVAFVDMEPIIMRSQILLYFVFGIYIALYRTENIFGSKKVIYFTSISVAILFLVQLLQPFYSEYMLFLSSETFKNIIVRSVCALSFWYLAYYLSSFVEFKSTLIKHVEPAIFIMFLSHVLFSNVVASVYSHLTFLHAPALFFIVWVSLPLGSLASSIVANKYMYVFPSVISLFLTGKESKKVIV